MPHPISSITPSLNFTKIFLNPLSLFVKVNVGFVEKAIHPVLPTLKPASSAITISTGLPGMFSSPRLIVASFVNTWLPLSASEVLAGARKISLEKSLSRFSVLKALTTK
jgi:hypothetical protein